MSTTASLTLPPPALLAVDSSDEPSPPAGAAAPTDHTLLERVARGDKEAFTVIYRRYERPVFGVLLRLAGRRALAEEWLQEAFTRVWLAAGTHDPARGAVRPWIYAIALNTARSELSRKRNRAPHLSLDQTGMDLEDASGGEPPLAARLDGQRRAEALAAALRELPEYLREVVVLRCSRELSFAEIAAVTGAPQGTLKSRFHRAVNALRARIDRREGTGR
ncbi:MAG TPA: sigma-70 family RNA polymerase sigma factor [Vicinamibacteria bacterium]|nr:sigma-70 family RNA polymerase sigma factor [Vicinamibacteria bacterium]